MPASPCYCQERSGAKRPPDERLAAGHAGDCRIASLLAMTGARRSNLRHEAAHRNLHPVVFPRILFWRRPRINVVELHGLIAPRPGMLSAASRGAADRSRVPLGAGQPVILDIESPGGSPVQSDLIASLIRRRAEEHKVRVLAVIREVGASGGYWLACAADEIHANPMSIVGSIGVRGGGFGFPDLLARIGVERRLYTAGHEQGAARSVQPGGPEGRRLRPGPAGCAARALQGLGADAARRAG